MQNIPLHRRDSTNPVVSETQSLPFAFLGIAILCCLVSGWSSHVWMIGNFENLPFSMQRATAAAYALIALAIMALILDRRIPAALMLLFPSIVGIIGIVQEAAYARAGLNGVPFVSPMTCKQIACASRPGPMQGITILLLILTTCLLTTRGRNGARAALLVASLTMGIAVLSTIALPLDGTVLPPNGFHLFMPAPAGLITALITIAAIHWRQERAWPGLFSGSRAGSRTIRAVFVICILVPIMLALTMMALSRTLQPSVAVLEIIQAMIQIIVSVGILFWAWSGMSRASATQVKLISALDTAPIAITDVEGKIIYWSKGCEQLYQWSAPEAVGRIKHDLLRSISKASGKPLDLLTEQEREIIERKRDGSPADILEHIRLVEGTSKRDTIIVMSMTDITARKKIEKALREADARLALAVEVHEIGIFEWSLAGDTVTYTAQAERLLGLPQGTISLPTGRAEEFISTRFDRQFFPAIDAARAARIPRVRFQLRRNETSDTPQVIEGWARCFYADEGQITGMLGIMLDTSEQERRATILESRESELRAILSTVPDALVTIDIAGRVRSFSANAERLFGYAAAEIVGRDASILIPHKFKRIYHRFISRFLKTGEYPPVGPAKHWMASHRDGSEIPVKLSVGEARSGEERILTLFVRDLREQIADQARLAKLREELLHVSRLSAMGEMAAGLAHELNQPLAAMSNFVGAADLILAHENFDKGRVAELLKLTASQAMRAGEIIRRVRSFASRGEVEFRALHLDELIADSIDLALTSTERRGIDIRTEIDPDHATIFADRIQIQQVLVNMTRNAIEAMTDARTHHPQIIFTTRGAEDHMVEIAVNDNGPGIPFDVLNRNHEHFVSSKAHGMGIGLSICRRIVEAHHGQLFTENLQSIGAGVRFTVPAFGEMERKIT